LRIEFLKGKFPKRVARTTRGCGGLGAVGHEVLEWLSVERNHWRLLNFFDNVSGGDRATQNGPEAYNFESYFAATGHDNSPPFLSSTAVFSMGSKKSPEPIR
jgi:hypothetical protein